MKSMGILQIQRIPQMRFVTLDDCQDSWWGLVVVSRVFGRRRTSCT